MILKFGSFSLPPIFFKTFYKEGKIHAREHEHGEKWNRGFVLIAIKLFKRTFVSKAIMELEERLRLVSRGGIWICPFLVYGQLCGLCILKIVAFSFRSLSKFVGRIY